MSTASRLEPISIEEYLAGELVATVKHEYLGGRIYAMAGVRNAHDIISTNIISTLHGQLRGKPCRPFSSDVKIRIRLPSHVRFYYPDASIVCRPNPQSDSFQDEPVVLFEVLSQSTRRIDEGEKRDAYLTIPSLAVYAMVEQEQALVRILRRTEEGFVPEVYEGLEATLPLAEINCELPLAEIYDGVEFQPE